MTSQTWRLPRASPLLPTVPGLDAHALHHFARLTGSRYQDVVAVLAKRVKPPEV